MMTEKINHNIWEHNYQPTVGITGSVIDTSSLGHIRLHLSNHRPLGAKMHHDATRSETGSAASRGESSPTLLDGEVKSSVGLRGAAKMWGSGREGLVEVQWTKPHARTHALERLSARMKRLIYSGHITNSSPGDVRLGELVRRLPGADSIAARTISLITPRWISWTWSG